MNKYEFSRRLKRIFHEECEIVKTDAAIAHKSAKYNEEMCSLKTMLAKQEQELIQCRRVVDKFRSENERLEKFTQIEEERLCTIIQKVEQMQAEYQQMLQKQIENRKTALFQMDCTRSIKQATQIYINLKALPHITQGVTICEKESFSEWKPFRIDSSKYTQEVQNMIWYDTQIGSIYEKTWQKLILGNILSETSKTGAELETETEIAIKMM